MVTGFLGFPVSFAYLSFTRRFVLKKMMLPVIAALSMFLPLLLSGAVQAAAKIPYSPQAVDSALAKGCSVFLEFGASW
ncbi:MAG: hypothetical protein HOH26_01260 [Alphaproteobacteria bacterium]|nr:hypothetical protein [Alphaproteobacteria bacterium]MBT5161693.1 hypothetical protein [Alphaproteobacteria bacterium]MBT5917120.1 hypothetical protein [Alphaproteobacteria bacterium]